MKRLIFTIGIIGFIVIGMNNPMDLNAQRYKFNWNQIANQYFQNLYMRQSGSGGAVCSNLTETDFEDGVVGTGYTRDYWEAAGFNPDNWDSGLEKRTKIVDDEAYSGSKSLEVLYPKGKSGSKETGTQLKLSLEPEEEYYLSYRIKFSDDFSWGSKNKGGKLPGLIGGEHCGSDFHCDGTDGFSARYMWRGEGYPEVYLYSYDMERSQYGDDIPFMIDGEKMQFETGKWYTITQHIKINSSATSDDGILEVWADNQQVISLDDITYVTNDQLIDALYFSTFHGGHNSTWAPENDSSIYFDDIKVSTCKDGVDF